ncbi:MarR family winged helix-turn-helix transcriptional regulator [Oceanirhabdus sp. W0125-5]|uniref:MarR family winged helix-turn-helix transcriptional regulator n=1 Tax=Oceanirhabdus sp. W0125-5 TaxID=2999116 RepID=UPI0022F31950|nr:MarR family transcriptional regulator [Oceanirhabdus sp. W0125-5]WBW96419.1 MarR family transcriptional regulator [Oceanirhabdus sp. W0125-5]
MKQISESFGRRLQNTGITRIQWIALYYIKENPSISQRSLSNMMSVKDSSIGRLLDRLERDGLVIKERSNKDRRIIYVNLTEKGQELIEECLPIGVKFNEDLTKGISQEELRIFEEVLLKMKANVVEEDV